MKYRKNVTVLVPSELLYAFDPDQDNVFIAARERGMIVLRPIAASSASPCDVSKSDFQKGYRAGMSAGYDKGYSDAMDYEALANKDEDVCPDCAGFCYACPHYDDLFDVCRFYS